MQWESLKKIKNKTTNLTDFSSAELLGIIRVRTVLYVEAEKKWVCIFFNCSSKDSPSPTF